MFRRSDIGRHSTPRGRPTMRREKAQDVSARVGLAGELVLRRLGALLQNFENLLARQVFLGRRSESLLQFPHPCSFRAMQALIVRGGS